MNGRWKTLINYNHSNDNPLQFIYGPFLGNLPFVPECLSSQVSCQHFLFYFIYSFILTNVFQWLNLIFIFYLIQKYQKLVLQTPIQMYFCQNLWFKVKLFNDGFVLFLFFYFFIFNFTSHNWWTGAVWITCGLLWCFISLKIMYKNVCVCMCVNLTVKWEPCENQLMCY